jgi:hypothetical protein
MSHEITSVRTMFNRYGYTSVTREDGTCLVTVKIPQGCLLTCDFTIECENFVIDSTLRPVFSFSDRCPEPRIGALAPYVSASLKQHRDRGFTAEQSPSGYDGDFSTYRADGDDTVAWIRSGLWEEMDSSAVAEYGKYCVQSGKLELFSREAVSGLSCCGYDIAPNGDIVQPYDGEIIAEFGSRHYVYVLCETAVSGSGFNAGGEWQDSGNNHAELMRKARAAVSR